MTWGVHNIDDVLVPANRSIFGFDRDAAFPLLVHGIHRSLCDHLIIPESTGLPKQLVNQGRFTVINVGNDRNVANLFCPGGGGIHRGAGDIHSLIGCKP